MNTPTSFTAVGDELPALSPFQVTRTVLALFAGASGDHNPMHIDIDVARSVGLEDVFAHGMLSMALLGRILTSWVPQERIVSYGVRFVSITPVNSQIRCTGEVVAVHGRRATVELRAALDDGTVTVVGDAIVTL